MSIDATVEQFRTTGTVRVSFDRKQCEHQLAAVMMVDVVVVLLLAFCVTRVPGVFADSSTVPKVLLVLALVVLVAGLAWITMLHRLIVGRRGKGWPGVELSRDGVLVAGRLTRTRPLIPWSSIQAISQERPGSRRARVTISHQGTRTAVPPHLIYSADQLHALLESTRTIATGVQHR